MNCCASNKHRLRILIYKLAMQHRSLRWVPYSRQPETCFSVASYRYIRWTPISGIARKPSITWEGVSYSPWQITVFRLLFWLWKNPGVTRDGHSSPFSAEFRFPRKICGTENQSKIPRKWIRAKRIVGGKGKASLWFNLYHSGQYFQRYHLRTFFLF